MWIDKPLYPKRGLGPILIVYAEILDCELMVWEQAFRNLVIPSWQSGGGIFCLSEPNNR